MKYGLVRFVSGFCGVVFIVWAAVIFAYDVRHYNRLLQIEFRRYMIRDVVTFGFGIFCLVRFLHWDRKALTEERDHTPS
jgi:hypothetical protein